jgi:hypothetical protein|tara:strand:+ start:195 stop:356 length:162 start_codon:yes stop_codon:yes gene_type:complete
MGRAIETENRLDKSDLKQKSFDRRLKLVEDTLEEIIQTSSKHKKTTRKASATA